MIEAYKKFWTNYTNFNGRSTRSDYWYVVLMNFLIGIAFGVLVVKAPDLEFLVDVYSLATFIPGLALVIRRLHDINKSGWNYFILFIPLVGWIIFIIFLCRASVNENNKYGQIA